MCHSTDFYCTISTLKQQWTISASWTVQCRTSVNETTTVEMCKPKWSTHIFQTQANSVLAIWTYY